MTLSPSGAVEKGRSQARAACQAGCVNGAFHWFVRFTIDVDGHSRVDTRALLRLALHGFPAALRLRQHGHPDESRAAPASPRSNASTLVRRRRRGRVSGAPMRRVKNAARGQPSDRASDRHGCPPIRTPRLRDDPLLWASGGVPGGRSPESNRLRVTRDCSASPVASWPPCRAQQQRAGRESAASCP